MPFTRPLILALLAVACLLPGRHGAAESIAAEPVVARSVVADAVAADSVAAEFVALPTEHFDAADWAVQGVIAASGEKETFAPALDEDDAALKFTLDDFDPARDFTFTADVQYTGERSTFGWQLGQGGAALIGTLTYNGPRQMRYNGTGGQAVMQWADGGNVWLPVTLEKADDHLTFTVMGNTLRTIHLDELAGPLSLSLSGDVKLRRPRVRVHDAVDSRYHTIAIDAWGNAAAEASDVPEPGLVMHSDTPFVIGSADRSAIDVAPSMAGITSPFQPRQDYLRLGQRADRNNVANLKRLVYDVPGDQYSTLHLLAYAPGRENHTPHMTVRIGWFGNGSGILEDTRVEVAPTPAGERPKLQYIRVPIPHTANVREFETLQIEFTREPMTHGRLPDPAYFTQAPLGPPSDVVVVAATLERSPVIVWHHASQGVNVFHDSEPAEFDVTLTSRTDQPLKVTAFLDYTGPGTGEQHGITPESATSQKSVTLAPWQTQTISLRAQPVMRGWYAARIGAKLGDEVVQARDTSFAILAPDTRQAKDDSPFGVWCFWNSHVVAPAEDHRDRLGMLMQHGGWRWTYGGAPAPLDRPRNPEPEDYHYIRDNYGVQWNMVGLPHHQLRQSSFTQEQFDEDVPEKIAFFDEAGVEPSYKILHESRTSGALLLRYSKWLGGEPYDMPADEQARLQRIFDDTVRYSRLLREQNPAAVILFGNDYPAFINAFLAKKLPSDAFDVIGSEGAQFMRQPERQPDWHSLLGFAAEYRRAMQAYGYDKPLWTTEALYHGTNPGNLTIDQQASIAVREAMLALQIGYSRMAAAGVLIDPASSYHWSNWGAAGFCWREPEYNPKPSYAMYAWLTQVLDQAQPAGYLAHDSTTLHVLDFVRPDGTHVYPVWTPTGLHQVTLGARGLEAVYDAFGNEVDVQDAADNRADDDAARVRLTASEAPLYVVAKAAKVLDHAPVEMQRPLGKVVVDFGPQTKVTQINERSEMLERNWQFPRIAGRFKHALTDVDGSGALRVTMLKDNDDRRLLPRYVQFELADPVTLQGRPKTITARVKGNGGWGRVMFELVDASGRSWTSSGNMHSSAANGTDPKGLSFFSFDGWHTIHFPLPGQYESSDQNIHLPYNYNWWPTGGPEQDGTESLGRFTRGDIGGQFVAYPLTLRRIIVTQRPEVLYVDDQRPVPSLTVAIDKIGVLEE